MNEPMLSARSASACENVSMLRIELLMPDWLPARMSSTRVTALSSLVISDWARSMMLCTVEASA